MIYGNTHPLRIARHKARLTQHQLAKLIGRSQTFIYEIEAGYKNPTKETVRALALALRCRIKDLMPEEKADV